MLADIPPDIKYEVDLEFAISDRICELMKKKGLSKLELARSLGKRPSEVTKWVSGQHNFTIRTLSLLSAFFGEDLIMVSCQRQ
ncbi:MAG: helix-turn-helix transcriptional regulator [Bacteroidales bacterium]|nr:helix-turn-helix transcriptional regulator [Bacteroidales bacterium]